MILHSSGGMGTGQVARQWGTTAEWVAEHLPRDSEGGLISPLAMSEFVRDNPEVYELRPQVD